MRSAWVSLALGLAAILAAVSVRAETPQRILDGLIQAARAEQPGFTASAARGEQFYLAKQSGGKEADSCAVCHTRDARVQGQHPRTHKIIEPLAPVANRERFTDPEKVEKWFKRNCREVLGRVCTPQEKADFAAYVISIK